MASFTPSSKQANDFNNGNEYVNKVDSPSAEDFNNVIESQLYTQGLATNQPDVSEANNVGTPSVEIITAEDGSAKMKFKNLKGEGSDNLAIEIIISHDGGETIASMDSSYYAALKEKNIAKSLLTVELHFDDDSIVVLPFQSYEESPNHGDYDEYYYYYNFGDGYHKIFIQSCDDGHINSVVYTFSSDGEDGKPALVYSDVINGTQVPSAGLSLTLFLSGFNRTDIATGETLQAPLYSYDDKSYYITATVTSVSASSVVAAVAGFVETTGAMGATGEDGADGAAATIQVGTVTTGEPGTNAAVNNSGTANAAVLDFTIPQGEPGTNGTDGVTPNISMTATVDNNVGTPSVNVTKSGTDEAPQFNLDFHNLKGASGSGSIPVVNNGTSNTTATIQPNTVYVWGEVASLNITLATPTDNSILNEYHFFFKSGDTPTTLTLPANILWEGEPTIDSNKTYEVVIVNNCGTIIGYGYSLLPSEYRLVKCLISDGTNYITITNSDFLNFSNATLSCQFEIIGNGWVFGTRRETLGYVRNGISVSGSNLAQLMSGTLGSVSGETLSEDILYDIEATYTVDGNTGSADWTINDTPQPQLTISEYYSASILFIFKLNSTLKIYGAKFQNTSLNFNFIPAVRKVDNKPGMFDTVGQLFYTNAGEGADFTWEEL